MYTPPPDPDPNKLALALSILEDHEAGSSYQEIGNSHGFSRGKAHHLATDVLKDRGKAARAMRRLKARRNQLHKPDPLEVLAELRADMRRVEPVVRRYPDPEGLIDLAINEGDRFYEDCRIRIGGALGEGREISDELFTLVDAYTELLTLAQSLDETLQSEVKCNKIIEVFHADVQFMAELTGTDLGDGPERWSEEAWALRPRQAAKRPPAMKSMSELERYERDVALVGARSRGVPEKAVADTHKISVRQVRRIASRAKLRKAFSRIDPVAQSALERTLAKNSKAIATCKQRLKDEELEEEERLTLISEISRLEVRELQIYGSAGMLTPDAAQAAHAARREARIDLVQQTTTKLRAVLGERGVEKETIEAAIDGVLEVSGIGPGGGPEIFE